MLPESSNRTNLSPFPSTTFCLSAVIAASISPGITTSPTFNASIFYLRKLKNVSFGLFTKYRQVMCDVFRCFSVIHNKIGSDFNISHEINVIIGDSDRKLFIMAETNVQELINEAGPVPAINYECKWSNRQNEFTADDSSLELTGFLIKSIASCLTNIPLIF